MTNQPAQKTNPSQADQKNPAKPEASNTDKKETSGQPATKEANPSEKK
jgi:hypothetical protein